MATRNTPRGPSAVPNASSPSASRLRRIIGTKSETVRSGGRDIPNDRLAIVRQLARGSDEDRATLKEIVDNLSDKERQGLMQAIAVEYRNPRTGGVGLTAEGEEIVRLMRGEEVPSRAEAEPGRTRKEPIVDDPVEPPRSNPRPKPAGFDPEAAGVKDPGGNQHLSSEPQLQGPDLRVESIEGVGPDGQPIETLSATTAVDQDGNPIGGRLSGPDYAAKRAAEEWERGEGPKPKPLTDAQAAATDRSQQQAFDESVMALVRGSMPQGRKGRTATGVYTPPSGQRDHAMAIWELLRLPVLEGKGGKKKRGAPNAAFTSARQMAEHVIRNTSTELLERPALTPSQAKKAKDVLGYEGQARRVEGQGPLTNEAAKQMLATDTPDIPVAKGKRKDFEEQAIQRLTKEFEQRFGDKWGENYKPSEASIGDEGDIDGITEAGVESRMPPEPVGTTQDPSRVPPKPDNVRPRSPAPAPIPHPESRTESLPMSPEDVERANRLEALRAEWADRVKQWQLDQPVRGVGVEKPEPDTIGSRSLRDALENPNDPVEAEGAATRPAGEAGRSRFEKMLQDELDRMNAEEPEGAGKAGGKKTPAQQPLTAIERNELRKTERSSPENLAKRDRTFQQYSPFMPQLSNRLTMDLEKELESMLNDPSAKPEEIQEVQSMLKGAQMLDRFTFGKKPTKAGGSPLGGRVSSRKKGDAKGKGESKPEDQPVSDADNEMPKQEVVAEDDAPVISQRPGLVPTGKGDPVSDDSLNFRPDPNPPGTEIALRQGDEPVDGMPSGDDYSDPRMVDDSLDAEIEPPVSPDPEVIDAEFEVVGGRDPAMVPTGRGDPASPGDINFRPADEAAGSTAVDGGSSGRGGKRGKGGTEESESGGPQKTAVDERGMLRRVVEYPFRHPVKTALGAAALGLYNMASQKMMDDSVRGFEVEGRPSMEQMPDGAGMAGLAEDGSLAGIAPDEYGGGPDINGGMSPAERIRMLQRIRGYVPSGTPQTMYNWRG